MNALTRHIANHDPTRRRELSGIGTTHLRSLYFAAMHETTEHRATIRLAEPTAPRTTTDPHHRPLNYHYQPGPGEEDVRRALGTHDPPVVCALVLPL